MRGHILRYELHMTSFFAILPARLNCFCNLPLHSTNTRIILWKSLPLSYSHQRNCISSNAWSPQLCPAATHLLKQSRPFFLRLFGYLVGGKLWLNVLPTIQWLGWALSTPPPFYQLALIALVSLNEHVGQTRNYRPNTWFSNKCVALLLSVVAQFVYCTYGTNSAEPQAKRLYRKEIVYFGGQLAVADDGSTPVSKSAVLSTLYARVLFGDLNSLSTDPATSKLHIRPLFDVR